MMTVHARSGGVYVEGIARAYTGGSYTDVEDPGFILVNGQWVQFQPPPQSGAMKPVENLRLDPGWADNPTDQAARVLWDLPIQDPHIRPNEVWLRVPEQTTIWSIYDYPMTSWENWALQPDTWYSLHVMLVQRSGFQPLVMSPIRAISFKTDAVGANQPQPQVGSPGDNDKEIVVYPAPAGCDVEWKLEIQNPDGTWSLVPGQTGTLVGTVAQTITILSTVFVAGRNYRFATRPVCGGVPGAWTYQYFMVGTNNGDPCGTGNVGLSNFADAKYILSKVCSPFTLKDGISNAAVGRGPGAQALYLGPYGQGSYAILSQAGTVQQVLETFDSDIDLNGDWTILRKFYLPNLLPAGHLGYSLHTIDGRYSLLIRRTGTGMVIEGYVYDGIARPNGFASLMGVTNVTIGQWHTAAMTFKRGGACTLYLDGNIERAIPAWR